MKNLVALVALLLTYSASAQTWNSLTFDADQDSIAHNTLKRFLDLFEPSSAFPRSIEAKFFGLDEVMNGKRALVAWIDRKGASALNQQYAQLEKDVAFNTYYYYRLVQQDLNGTKAFSDVPSTKITNDRLDVSSSLRVFPNPTSGSTNLELDEDLYGPLKVFNIVDQRGSIVAQPTVKSKSIDLSQLPNGMYYLQVEIRGEQVVKRINKH